MELWYSEELRNMNSWIAEFFEHGHNLSEIYNMNYTEYQTIIAALCDKRSGNKNRNLRPVQKSAIAKAKELKKK